MIALKVFSKIPPPDMSDSCQEELYNKMPQNIKSVLSDKNSSKRMISLLGWDLLAENLLDKTLLAKVDFEEKGKPFIPNSNVYFNISNTKGIVVLVIHNRPVGIDIERLRAPRENIFSRVFCVEEIKSIDCAEDFTRLWTRKEAVVKLFGGGISMGLNSFSVLKDKFEAFGKIVEIKPVLIDGFISHIAIYS
jgi:4'-phosphopantetheinyl transferase